MRNATQPAAARRRLAAVAASAIVLVGAAIVASGSVPGTPAGVARADEVTASANNLRDGWDPSEPNLSPAVVGGGTFGQLFSTAVNGQVYAQPVIAGSTLIVATENDYVYGLDRTSGAVEWSDSLGPPLPASAQSCSDLTPNVGITGTPVYDPNTGNVYLVAVVNDGPSVSQPSVYMYAIDAQTGTVNWHVPIQGAPVNDPTRPFNPLSERERAGLLLMNGTVYAAFGAYCDYEPYVGYVASVNTTSQAVSLWTDEAGLTDSQAGIWLGGGGVMSDGPGRVFVTSGNGVSPPPGPGSSPPEALGDSVVRLNVGSGGTMSAADFFSPANAPALDLHDHDFGSGDPVGLPFGTATYPDLLVQAGKGGRVFLLNRNNLGGREQGPGGTDADVSVSGPYGGQWGHPAAFGDTTTVGTGPSNDFAYYVGRNDYLRYLKFEQDSSGTPVLTDVANSASTFGYSSGSPVVTSNGTDPSSAVVWEIYVIGSAGTGAMLEAFDGVPPSSCTASAVCTMTPIWSAPIGVASKFATPATNDGIVYVGTRDGHVLAFGSPDHAPLSGSPVDFSQVAVGKNLIKNVTVTASTSVTVSAVSVSGSGFTAGSPSQALPATLAAGQSLTVPVTYAPTSPGGVTGALTLATNSANFPAVSVGLTGYGTAAGFYATPASLSFGSQPDGIGVPATVTITNSNTVTEQITSTGLLAAPFSVTGLPADGTSINPGGSVTATVTYLPTAPGPDTASLTVGWSAGNSGPTGTLTIGLTGTGVADDSNLTPTPTAISFGSVPMGQQATKTIQIANAGNLPATVTASSALAVPFGNPDPITSGLPLGPGYDLQVPVTFTPSSPGAVSGSFKLTWTDVKGTHTLSVPVSGTGTEPASGTAVSEPGGGWTLNGSAQAQGTSLVLTQAVNNQDGSAVYSVPVASNGLTATFTAKIGGGNGADGMTMSLLDATTSTPGSLGGGGGSLGFGGLHGVAIALDTHQNPGDPSGNFVGIATGASSTGLHYAATATDVPDLRSGTHTLAVTVSGQQVTVSIDGRPVLDPTLPAGTVPPSVLVAFTGATGGKNDIHQVIDATITTGGANLLPAPGGGWSYNGSAQANATSLVLTRAVNNQDGSAVYSLPVPTNGLAATFTAKIGGGTGADGMTFALLSPATAVTAVGGGGGRLGFGGLHGVAIALDTHQNPGDPSGNFVGIATGASSTGLDYAATATDVPNLRSGTHSVGVTVAGQRITVTIDGKTVLSPVLPAGTVPPSALVAFTGATGGLNDIHQVTDASITAGGGILPPPGGGWSYNGRAQAKGTSLVLTQAVNNQDGSAVYSVPVASNGLTATFTAKIGGGSGADGMTLSLLDATTSTPASLGGGGGRLGFGGLHGVAIALDTYQNTGDPSGNFVGIATGTSSTGLHYAATATDVPNLRSGTHTLAVTVSGQQVTVSIDGMPVLSPTLPAGTVPPSVLVAFTGATGGLNDIHQVIDATITTGGANLPPPGGGWSYNASASMSGSDTVLTPAAKYQAGSVIYPVPVSTSNLQVQFDAQLSGGTGADGLTFALLNPATPVTAVGGDGGELGFGGLSGVAVALDTHQNTGYPTNNFVGVTASISNNLLSYQSTARLIPPLRTSTHTVIVQVIPTSYGPVVVVYLDGELVLAEAEPSLGSTALLAFTGGTGGVTDVHTVRDVAISASG